MHMVYRLQQLISVVLDPLFWQIVHPPLNRIIQVHVHEFEDEGETASRLVIKYLV